LLLVAMAPGGAPGAGVGMGCKCYFRPGSLAWSGPVSWSIAKLSVGSQAEESLRQPRVATWLHW
jgi:hypothetical protein